jgi:hypothetical protein
MSPPWTRRGSRRDTRCPRPGRVRAAREEIGDNAELYLDTNGGYTVGTSRSGCGAAGRRPSELIRRTGLRRRPRRACAHPPVGRARRHRGGESVGTGHSGSAGGAGSACPDRRRLAGPADSRQHRGRRGRPLSGRSGVPPPGRHACRVSAQRPFSKLDAVAPPWKLDRGGGEYAYQLHQRAAPFQLS